jgi:hypothetical protein
VADHEIAHVYVRHPDDIEPTAAVLRDIEGVEAVLAPAEQDQAGIGHEHAGEFVLLAEEGCWLAYPWWRDPSQAPDFASHVDIHNKPGFDPCELFFGWPPPGVSQNLRRVRGTHGRTGPGREVAWATTFDPGRDVRSLLDLSHAVADRLETSS